MLLYLNKVFRFDSHNSWMALLFFALSMAVCFFAYSQGWSGGWHFDDAPNLRPLEQVFELGIINSDAWLFFNVMSLFENGGSKILSLLTFKFCALIVVTVIQLAVSLFIEMALFFFFL